MRTPPRSPRPYDGELRCHARTWPTDPPCTDSAAWHVAWLLAPRGHFSLVCDEHMAGLTGVYDYVDRHPADIMCAMPGSGWQTGTVPSRCVAAPAVVPER
ncbi:hypothetical protein [Streptomyces sp. G1]|uniref:hypothetical protein n=1 Tax=Streptomyces sp. G1 TaxID=361572 RepID=UPI00203076ED|nr:hypothetical protein [Streptomyces sp. G1]MCM1972298.1 hypothetical protein [Streptomyces sp. G1]